jgi:hypothetical protein
VNVFLLKEAKQKEIEFISLYNSFKKGYNSTLGGDVSGKHSNFSKWKISRNKKGKKIKPHTKEHNKNISLGWAK